MHRRCCCPPESDVDGLVEPVLHLVPERRLLEAAHHDFLQARAITHAGQLRAVDDVLANGAGQRQRQGKHHAHPPPQRGHRHVRAIDVLAVEQDVALHPRAVQQVVQPVDEPQQGRLAAARRAEEHGDRVGAAPPA